MSIRKISVSKLANGTEIELYLHEIVGKLGDGLTVGLSAAIHGDEPTDYSQSSAAICRWEL